MKFYNVRNGGIPSVEYGFKLANSYNVAPTTYVALPTTGVAIPLSELDKYDWFTVTQTSAATDLVILPNAPIGTIIRFFSTTAVRIKAAASSGIGTNGGTDAQGITTVAGDLHEFVRASATNWLVSKVVAAGTVSVPVSA